MDLTSAESSLIEMDTRRVITEHRPSSDPHDPSAQQVAVELEPTSSEKSSIDSQVELTVMRRTAKGRATMQALTAHALEQRVTILAGELAALRGKNSSLIARLEGSILWRMFMALCLTEVVCTRQMKRWMQTIRAKLVALLLVQFQTG